MERLAWATKVAYVLTGRRPVEILLFPLAYCRPRWQGWPAKAKLYYAATQDNQGRKVDRLWALGLHLDACVSLGPGFV